MFFFFNSNMTTRRGPLAQPVEQLAFNQLVVRSNRTRPTTFTIFCDRASEYPSFEDLDSKFSYNAFLHALMIES